MPNTSARRNGEVILKYNYQMNAMLTTNLRKVGGSVMLAVPPALLDLLRLVGVVPEAAVVTSEGWCAARSAIRMSLDAPTRTHRVFGARSRPYHRLPPDTRR